METVLWRAFDSASVEKFRYGMANAGLLTKKGMVLHNQTLFNVQNFSHFITDFSVDVTLSTS